MFAFHDMKQRLRGLADVVFHASASVAFIAFAMVSIQYEEAIAPEMARMSSAATDIGKKLTGLAF